MVNQTKLNWVWSNFEFLQPAN